MDFTPEQLIFLERCKKSQERASDMATEALTLHLTILAREWVYIARQLEAAVQNQERAFRDQTLVQLDFNHPQEE
jgi:hypothetical protein